MRAGRVSGLIDRLVLGLPPSDRLVARMQALRSEGWTASEIGAELGMSADAVYQRLCRAKKPAPHSTGETAK